MTTTLQIDFVSDVVCPWCAIGLQSLERAAQRLEGEVALEWHFQPFELHPQMGPEGEDIVAYLGNKYGLTPEQVQQNQQAIAERGAQVGFRFAMDKRGRTYNTFDAHRLLHWAQEQGRQRELKHALLKAYFTEGQDVSQHAVLVQAAAGVGLDAEEARALLASDRFAAEVREREQFYQSQGIHSVPAIVINGRHLIQGGQPPEVFEQALRQIAAAA